jgi:protein-export membrane protein SecD
VLRAGALPATVKIVQNITVGPTLGADSIKKGLTAGLLATILVIGFMIFYYRFSGLVADYAVILNVILLLGLLSLLGATLTLPGIAGIILAIDMAVDANVLVFERIKEESALGKGVASSISLGFSRAFSAIFDSNLTTIISAIFLFQFGTGPIRGYAVTLTISLVANLFTAVFVSHLLFDLTVRKTAKTLSI